MEKRKRYISDKTSRIISIAITVCFVLAHTIYTEVALRFPGSIRRYGIFVAFEFLAINLLLLLIKFFIIACIESRNMLYEFKSILICIAISMPTILPAFSGNWSTFIQYICSFTFCSFLWVLTDIFKKKRADATSILLLLLTLIILFCYFTQGYYGLHSNPEFAIWKIIGYVAQLSIYLLIFIVAALLLIKDKWNLTKIIFAVASALIAWILIRFCHVPYDSLYLTVALIVISFIQISSKSKFETPAALALIAMIIQPTISTIRTIIRNNDFLSLAYYDFYLTVSLFLILVLLQRHTVFNSNNSKRRLNQ